MRMMLLAALLLPGAAAAFTAQNGMTAWPISATEIGVVHEVSRDDTDYWCAAADFARRGLGLPGATRLWRATPKPRPAGKGIVFTLDPANKAEGAGFRNFGAGPQDGSVSIASAVGSFCRIRRPDWWD